MTDNAVITHAGIAYANHDGVELVGDLFLPKGAKTAPALVAVHGGGWVQGARSAYQYWGPYLAARGVAVFAISYRLATKGKMFPQAVQDVLAGVQFVRGKAGEFGIDPARIGLLGASAGGHLAALAALNGKKFIGGYPQDAFASVSAEVKALIGVYGVYDLAAMWTTYQIQGGAENNIQKFLGAPPAENRQLYFDASPISYATFANNKIGVLLVTGTRDDLVDPEAHTEPFQLALKQANFFVRPCIVHGAPHYWMNDPIDEPGSYSDFLAPRLMRFLAEKL
jgi:acetyl esterase/lipase